MSNCGDFFVGTVFFLVSAPGIVLYPVAFFTPHWVSDSRCDVVGLLYKCCIEVENGVQNGTYNSTYNSTYNHTHNILTTTEVNVIATTDNFTNITDDTMLGFRSCNFVGKNALDVRVVGLVATSTTFALIIAVAGLCHCVCKCSCSDSIGDIVCGFLDNMWKNLELLVDNDDGSIITVQLLSGILSFSGCMLILKKYSTDQLGYSFYICLCTSSFVMLVIGLSITGSILYLIGGCLLECCEACLECCCESDSSTDDKVKDAATKVTDTKTKTAENDQVAGKKRVERNSTKENNAETVNLSVDDVAVKMKGIGNQVFASDEVSDDEEQKVPNSEDVAYDMSDQDTTTIIVQSAKPKPKSTNDTRPDEDDAKSGSKSVVEIEQDDGKSQKKKGGSTMAESLAKLNVKNLFVFSIGSCHCVCVTKKDENTEV